MPQSPEIFEEDGTVVNIEANARFTVEFDNGHTVVATPSGAMSKYNIKIIPGDRVRVEISPKDLKKGRITYRHR